MKRGRPVIHEYARHEFVVAALARMRALGISRTALADHSYVRRGDRLRSVNRGTLSRILDERIPAPLDIRITLMTTLQFEPELVARFSGASCFEDSRPMMIADYRYWQEPAVVPAANLLHQGFYSEAAAELSRVFRAAEQSGDVILQAYTAGHAALVHLEMGEFIDADKWAQRSITKCSKFIGLPVSDIIRTASRLSPESRPSGEALALRILSETLHNRCQIFARRMLYHDTHDLQDLARRELDTVLALDQRLDFVQPIGNDLRCKAVVEVATDRPNLQSALDLVSECEYHFPAGGLFEAHSRKTRGIITLRTGRPGLARRELIEAEKMLSSFMDARGLAATKYLISTAILRTPAKARQALPYILAAATLHPYGFVVNRFRQQANLVWFEVRDIQSEIDALIAGKGDYRSVHQMLAWLAQDSPYTAEDLLFRNLALVVAGNFPSVEIPWPASGTIVPA